MVVLVILLHLLLNPPRPLEGETKIDGAGSCLPGFAASVILLKNEVRAC